MLPGIIIQNVSCVYGLASHTTLVLQRGCWDMETDTVAIVSRFSLSGSIQGKCSNQFQSSFIVLINVDGVYYLCSALLDLIKPLLHLFLYFHWMVLSFQVIAFVFCLLLFFLLCFLSLIRFSFSAVLSVFPPRSIIPFDLCCHGSSVICSTGNAKLH